jgi:lytic murein transglycosylase
MSRLIRILACLLVLGGAARAEVNRPQVEAAFQAWLASDIWPEAKAAGVSKAAFDRALGSVTLDWDLPELQPPGSPPDLSKAENQTEFGPPGNYFGQKHLSALAATGRAKLEAWRPQLSAIEKKYGVPAPILVAIWGRETVFGDFSLPKPAIRTIATQAFMGMRKAMFRPELIAALVMVEQGAVAPDRFRSSWAGAIGQPQFSPTLFLKYAVDADGDGKRDIWASVPDSLASVANYLIAKGWKRERGWGLEAHVPATVACTLEGPEQGKPMAEWAKLGVTQVDGKPLPAREGRTGFLLMPAGRFGPAFIVTENFYVLKQYNYSDLYALYVGHLADRFSADRPFAASWSPVGGFSRGDVKRMQDDLVAAGYDVGNADGLIGFKTRIAVGLWQAKKGETPTCFPDAKLVKSIH